VFLPERSSIRRPELPSVHELEQGPQAAPLLLPELGREPEQVLLMAASRPPDTLQIHPHS
jgi:hypothetical protein